MPDLRNFAQNAVMPKVILAFLLVFAGLVSYSHAQAWEALEGPPGARAFALSETDGVVRLATAHGVYSLFSERWILERNFGFNFAKAVANAVYDIVPDAPNAYLAAVDTGLFRVSSSGAILLTLSLGRIEAVKVRKHADSIYLLTRNPNKLYRSIDGASWQAIADDVIDIETDDAGWWGLQNVGGRTVLLRNGSEIYPFSTAYSEAKLYVHPDHIAVASPAGLWISNAGGQNFSRVGPESAVGAYSPDGFLATGDGVVYRRDGDHWTPIFATPVPAKINAFVEDFMLCDDYFGVYKRSENTFSPFNAGLRNVTIKSVSESGGVVYAFAAEIGAFVSGSGGKGTWEKSGAGLPFTDADAVFAVGPQSAFLFSSLFKSLYVTDNRGTVWKKIEAFPTVQTMVRLSDGKFYACNDSTVFVSPDGRNWAVHSRPGEGFGKNISRAGDTLFVVVNSKLHYYGDGAWREYPSSGPAWGPGARVYGKNRLEFALSRTHGPFYRKTGAGFVLEHPSVSATAEFAGGQKLLVYAKEKFIQYEAGEAQTIDFVSSHWVSALAYSSDGKRIYVGTNEDGLYSVGEALERSRPVSDPTLRVYPNPARDVVNVVGFRGENISIFDATGVRVAELKAYDATGRWDVSGLAPGGYVLKAGETVVRFVVVR